MTVTHGHQCLLQADHHVMLCILRLMPLTAPSFSTGLASVILPKPCDGVAAAVGLTSLHMALLRRWQS